MEDRWQKDWKSFVDLLGEKLREGATNDDLATLFGSGSVTWTGVLKETRIDEAPRMVTLVFPHARIDLGDSVAFDLGTQSIPVATDSIRQWQSLQIGTAVTFTAVLGDDRSPFPPVEVIRLPSGRVVVMIRPSDARPVPRAG